MSNLRFVTLTGADENTSMEALAALSERFEYVEWGVLYSPDRAGNGGRYPSLEWLEKFAEFAEENSMHIALHICGSAVRDLMDAVENFNWNARPAPAQRLLTLAEKFGRVQINTRADVKKLAGYVKLVESIHRSENRTKVILQYNSHNAEVCERISSEYGIEFLVDASGGRGISPEAWPTLDRLRLKRAGYAGGLGPDNITEQVKLLAQVCDGRSFWLDMEGKLRDEDDKFDLKRCESVLEQVREYFLKPERKEAMALWGEGVRNVRELEHMWLDWWVARSTGRANRLVAPPPNACKAMYLWRQNGSYESFQPSENKSTAIDVLREERICLMPEDGEDELWAAWPVDKPECKAVHEDMLIAGLRAVVLKHFGETVPVNAYWEDGL